MRFTFRIMACFFTVISFASFATEKGQVSDQALEIGFVSPSDSIQTSVFRYWILDKFSNEGVIKRLYLMKKSGINLTFIGNVGIDDVSYGKVKMLNDEWWNIIHAALKTATELNIKIGIFNSPGLSQSGGTWVSANEVQNRHKHSLIFETLQDWTTSSDERIKYYSGTAFYTNKFELDQLPEGKKIVINLGNFTSMAKVSVNGTYVGGLWTAPYQLDITPFVKAGENDLKIEVVNAWVNRLIGDLKLPEDQRKTWCPINIYKPDSPLQPSGLFGPVTVSDVQY